MNTSFYKQDLAYIHDAGFGGPALSWAPALLSILRTHQIARGLIVDLGCGSGLLAEKLNGAGFQIYGVDSSLAFIRMARRRVPTGRFKRASLFGADLPRCSAVVSTGECLNYMFDSASIRKGLETLFRKVYAALEPGGLFAFDLADPGQVPEGKTIRGFTEGSDWIVLVEKSENHHEHVLTRRIITFRKDGKQWRRGEELHRQRFYARAEILRILKSVGFRAHALSHAKSTWLPQAHTAFLARKPD